MKPKKRRNSSICRNSQFSLNASSVCSLPKSSVGASLNENVFLDLGIPKCRNAGYFLSARQHTYKGYMH